MIKDLHKFEGAHFANYTILKKHIIKKSILSVRAPNKTKLTDLLVITKPILSSMKLQTIYIGKSI